MSVFERRRLLRRKPGQAMVRHRLYGPLAAGFAAFDLVRARVGGRTSQMFVELRRARDGEARLASRMENDHSGAAED
jgi:hypothetical protein